MSISPFYKTIILFLKKSKESNNNTMCMTECKKYNYIFILNTKTYALSLTEHALLSPLSVLLLGNYAPLLMIRALPWTNHAPLSGEHALFRKLYALSETKHAPSHGKDTLLWTSVNKMDKKGSYIEPFFSSA